MEKKIVSCALVAFLLTLSGVAWATVETNYWLSNEGGLLSDGANWSLGDQREGKVLAFTNSASYAITNALYTGVSSDLLFNAPSGTVTYVGTGGRNQRSLLVGTAADANATFIHSRGTIDAPYGYINVGQAGGHGTMIVTGTTARITTYYSISIGSGSDSNIVVVAGGANIRKHDNGSYFRVGYNGSHNQLLIRDGGSVTNYAYFHIGSAATDYSNRVEVCGRGSELLLDGRKTTWIGGMYGRYNALVATNGGVVRVVEGPNGLVIGRYARENMVVITGAESLLECNGPLDVGSSNNTTGNRLEVLAGGKVVINGVMSVAGANRTDVYVDGVGTELLASELEVGNHPAASRVEVTDGALLATPRLTIGRSTHNGCRIDVASATLAVTNATHEGRLELLRGKISLYDNARLLVDSLIVTNGAATTCQVEAVIDEVASGLEITSAGIDSLLLDVPGGITLTFTADPADPRTHLSGLTMPGDQREFLQGLVDAGQIVTVTTALSPATQRRFGVRYDPWLDSTLLGVEKKRDGTLLWVR